MQKLEADSGTAPLFVEISTNHQFREALARIRFLESAKIKSPEGRERIALELAVSRYLLAVEPPADRAGVAQTH